MFVIRHIRSSSAGLAGKRSKDEVKRIRSGASQFFRQITEVLAKVPPPLLLLFKTKWLSYLSCLGCFVLISSWSVCSDLLRALSNELKSTVNPYLILATYMRRGIRKAELERGSCFSLSVSRLFALNALMPYVVCAAYQHWCRECIL